MKTIALLAGVALAMAAAAPANAQTRYSTPPAAYLSADLASPWILQLRQRPVQGGRYAVEVSRPVLIAPARQSAFRQIRTGIDAGAPAQLLRTPKVEKQFDPQFEMQMVEYASGEAPGTIIIDTPARFLYLIEQDGRARRYGIGVGRPGFEWAGAHKVSRKAEWPEWNPPAEMIRREAKRGKLIPDHMDGGPENPLGARAMYLGDSLYRIHGTNQPWSIGQAVSSGCIRMRNEDVMDLYERVKIGTKVVVS